MLFKKVSFRLAKYVLAAITLLNVYLLIVRSNQLVGDNFIELNSAIDDQELFDWHDYKFMYLESIREGPGENGSSIVLTDPIEIKQNLVGYDVEGFYTSVSDKISPNRSVPDVRLEM